MFWLKKNFAGDQWFDVQDRFEAHFMKALGPREMMLVCADQENFRTDLFIGLPEGSSASLYEGFEKVDQPPERAVLLVGHQDEFEKRFKPVLRE